MQFITRNWGMFKNVMIHKWFVLVECIKLGVPLWRAIIHDWHKFTPVEWRGFVHYFYGGHGEDKPDWVQKAFDEAWLHHVHYGPHHWQYWIIPKADGDDILEMPEVYVKEMVADWNAAFSSYGGNTDCSDWYAEKYDDIVLHPSTRDIVNDLIGWHKLNDYFTE